MDNEQDKPRLDEMRHTCGFNGMNLSKIKPEDMSKCPKCIAKKQVAEERREVSIKSADKVCYENCEGGRKKRGNINLDTYDRTYQG